MSYLHLANGIPDFAKAVISFWFRIPTESIKAVRKVETGTEYLSRYIPLFTFGKKVTATVYKPVFTDIAAWHYTPSDGQFPIMAISDYVEAGEQSIDPSFVGLDCSAADDPCLIFNVQLSDRAPIKSAVWLGTKVDIYELVEGITFEAGNKNVGIGSHAYGIYAIKDVSYIRTAQRENFQVRTQHAVEADKWHHVLLSFDLSDKCSVGQPNPSSTCKLWYAIDDVNYVGQENLQPYRKGDDGLGPNDIVTQNIDRVSGGTPGPSLFQNQWVPATTGAYDPEQVPTDSQELGIPASTRYVNNIFRVEMAEFQMWTGITLDTKTEANRRIFIDYQRDEEGKIIKDEDNNAVLKSVDPKTAEDRLDRPQVLLHGSSNWSTGYNTGTTGLQIDVDGKLTKKPKGQFKPIALIRSYKPDPSLKVAAPAGG